MPQYNRVKHYSLGRPYWDIEVIPPSPDDDNYSYKFKINTEIVSAGDDEYTLPQFNTTNGLINVDWGDDTFDSNVSTRITHTYSSPGIYTVKLYPSLGHKIRAIYHDGTSTPPSSDNARKVLELIDWGDNISTWTTMFSHFRNCENLTGFTSNAPILTNVNTTLSMFQSASSFNSDISNWDVSSITNMNFMFGFATSFNQPLNSWDVSNVISMASMLSNTSFNQPLNSWDVSNVNFMNDLFLNTPFNQDISSWDVSNVNFMSGLFMDTPFNQDISSWDVSNVSNMGELFENNTSFNQDISSWNTSGVTSMSYLFYSATSFNQDISSWDTSNNERLFETFKYATSFDEDLGTWDISSLMFANGAFDNSGLSTTNYDNLLNGWASQAPNINSNVPFGAAGINRTSASLSAYNTLTTTYNWTITDAGLI